ncbi:MBL fold metallo-hydrolase [Actinophytocola oryzae]|uniref:Ribonuclease BN (tRNA processing enzyme) n=1 Tax=Actinophytocola oryzae TaxID=502181 RepID=A0A4R7VRD7_9PSEU|nr:MBL fold metallo-hydrolase [Actinophytocola oryzae]TDV52222.1 ribonuclease BN (tRNA processing enzyme) [Actinophytocola oryzae]
MRVTVLGCSGSTSGPHQPSSGYLIEADGFALGLELGNGTLAELAAVRDPLTLDALVFSHLHPDHCADFSALTVLRRWHPEPPVDTRARRLPVHAPEEAPTRFAAADAPDRAALAETDLTDIYDFRPLTPTVQSIGPFRVQAFEVDHPCETYGFRFTHDGRTLAYTADTGTCLVLDDLAADADTLLGEASWTHSEDRPPGVHLSGRQLGELATRARVKRLLITHVAPWTDPQAVLAEATEVYDGEVVLVEKRMTYRV